MPRIYARDAQYKRALEASKRLRNWKLHAAPMTVACRKLGVDEQTLHDLARTGRIKAFRSTDGVRYDVAAYLSELESR